ncbi:MAG: hypothetical protein QF479_01660 [Candidatus Poseidoniaceae archaeon]|jgi:hypothetical protein|nr:hypothetical protein [Candidatus Poseidoniaceae archaeon]
MGIETIVLLVEQSCLNSLLEITWSQLYRGMEKGDFRDSRPLADIRLNRLFDIDCEAELLDWMDSIECDPEMNVKLSLQHISNGSEGLLKLMQWASPGQWDSWEARTYLYLDVALNREIANRDDLYSHSTWNEIIESLAGMPEEEFAQKVCLDWMDRRKELGETLDETKDAKIIPTYEAHDRTSRLLVYAMTRWNNEEGIIGIVGREHMDAKKWGHGDFNIHHILNS